MAIAGVTAVACGSDDDSSSSSEPAEAKKLKVAFVSYALAAPAVVSVTKGFTDYAKSQGWEVKTADAEAAPDKANSLMQTMASQDVDLIATMTFPADTLASGLAAAKAAGAPVISFGSGVADGLQLSINNATAGGKIVADYMLEQSGGKGQLLKFGYSPGLGCQQREAALDAALKGSDIETTRSEVPIPGQVEASIKATQSWLTSHPASQGQRMIWTCFDDPGQGALSAIKQTGAKDVKIYAAGDGNAATLRSIQAGEIEAVAWSDLVALGEALAKAAPAAVEAGVDAPGKNEDFPVTLVTPDDVDQFLKENPGALKQG